MGRPKIELTGLRIRAGTEKLGHPLLSTRVSLVGSRLLLSFNISFTINTVLNTKFVTTKYLALRHSMRAPLSVMAAEGKNPATLEKLDDQHR